VKLSSVNTKVQNKKYKEKMTAPQNKPFQEQMQYAKNTQKKHLL
jgi:hypothetical protein